MTNEACCACRSIVYDTIDNGDGTVRDKWECRHCGAEFVRVHATLEVDDRVRDGLREELRIAKARIVERNRTAASILGGYVEGEPTSEFNWIQRARALVASEKRRDELRALASRRESERDCAYAALSAASKALASNEFELARDLLCASDARDKAAALRREETAALRDLQATAFTACAGRVGTPERPTENPVRADHLRSLHEWVRNLEEQHREAVSLVRGFVATGECARGGACRPERDTQDHCHHCAARKWLESPTALDNMLMPQEVAGQVEVDRGE